MLTALDEMDIKESAFRTGADDYLTKPFKREDLIARVLRALERTYGAKVKPQPAAQPAVQSRAADAVPAPDVAAAAPERVAPPMAAPVPAPPPLREEAVAQSPFAIVHNSLVSEADPSAAAEPEAPIRFDGEFDGSEETLEPTALSLDAAEDLAAQPEPELEPEAELAPADEADEEPTIELESAPPRDAPRASAVPHAEPALSSSPMPAAESALASSSAPVASLDIKPPMAPVEAPTPTGVATAAEAQAPQVDPPSAPAVRPTITPRPPSVGKGALPSAAPNRQDIWKKFVSQRRT
jgi:hypothetical protein